MPTDKKQAIHTECTENAELTENKKEELLRAAERKSAHLLELTMLLLLLASQDLGGKRVSNDLRRSFIS